MPLQPSDVKAVFVDALEKQPAQRAAYLAEACARAPALRQRVEELLRACGEANSVLDHPVLQRATPEASDVTADCGMGDNAHDTVFDFLQPPARPDSRGRLGHFEVLEVLGRGGFGIVFKAFDEVLHRVVAVKVLAPRTAPTASASKRFLREARASAAVRHDNVVQVFAIEEQPLPYLVIEYIAGPTLQQLLDTHGPLAVADVLRIGVQLARGLAAAHALGLIHRDVKPSNVLLEGGPEGRAKLTDFGLARAADDASVTQSGTIAGTPLFMAPEQARGESLDQRADLFSLGSVLYALCTGQPPFRAPTTFAVLKRVAEDDPRPIHEVVPGVPAWLRAIIARLHAREPAARFQAAAEVAEILERCQHQLAAGETPGPLPAPPRRRRRWQLSLALAAVVALGCYLAVGSRDRRDAPVDPGMAPGQPALSAEAWQPEEPPTPEQLAALSSPFDGRKRSEIAPHLLAWAGGGDPDKAPVELVAVLGYSGPFALPARGLTHEPAVSADGKTLAGVCDTRVAVFDTATGTLRRTLSGATQQLHRVAFSHDGRRIGGPCSDGNAYVWDTESGTLQHTLAGHTGFVHAIAFSPDGKRLATAGNDGSLFLWDADGRSKTVLATQLGVLRAVAFSPDSTTLVCAGDAGAIVFWDTADGKRRRSLQAAKPVRALHYSPNGRTLVTGSDSDLVLWDLKIGKPRHTLAGAASGLLAVVAGGTTVLAARWMEERGGGYCLTRWDAATGKRTADVPLGPRRPGLHPVRFYGASPDGTTVYACHYVGDNRVSVFDAVTGTERFPDAGFHSGPVWALALSPDGKTLATGGDDRTVRLWDLAGWHAGQRLPPGRILTGHANTVYPLAFSPNGRLLASGDANFTVLLWDPRTGTKLHDAFGTLGSNVCSFSFTPDSQALACPRQDGSVVLYSTAGGAPVAWKAHGARVRSIAFSPNGRLVASGGDDTTVAVVDRVTGRQLLVLPADTQGLNVAFSRDGKTLAATTGEVGQLLAWDLADVKKVVACQGHKYHVQALALHPLGRLAATGSWDGTVRVWDLPTGRSRVFDSHQGIHGRVDAVAFTPEGRYLLAASASGVVCIWKTPEFPTVTSKDTHE